MIGRVRKLAVGVAEAWVEQQYGGSRCGPGKRDRRVNLLLEIGAEEIPDSMLASALDYLGATIGSL